MEQLTVKEYAELRGISERHARRLVTEGSLPAKAYFYTDGSSTKKYLISLTDIDPKLQKKYMRLHREKFPQLQEKKQVQARSLEEMTHEERKEAAFRLDILTRWRAYREHYGGSRKEADTEYVRLLRERYPDKHFSPRMLQRQWKAYKEGGEGALADGRGKHKNHATAIPENVFDIFQYYYLDESQKSVRKCMELTELVLREESPGLLPLASEASFSRKITRDIPVPVLAYYRKGEKAFRDRCAPYIERSYEDLDSNDIWVCDNHTFDVFVNDGEHKKPVRVYLTAFQDVRSRKMTGWHVTLNPCSDATLAALRRGIERYGIPKRILSDNVTRHFIVDGKSILYSTALTPLRHLLFADRALLSTKLCGQTEIFRFKLCVQ